MYLTAVCYFLKILPPSDSKLENIIFNLLQIPGKMINHIVMWKLKEFSTIEEREAAAIELRRRLMTLKNLIPEIRTMEVGINASAASDTNYEVVLISEFESFETLKVYQEHFEHKKLIEFLAQIRIHRVAIDYEINK
jgi:hypothetical protein